MSAPEPTKGAGPTEQRSNVRWMICGLLFFSVALNYIDRNSIGILKAPLSKELGWSETDYAHIASAFQMAYGCGYLFGGRVVDWLGVKRALPWFVALWSLAAAAHGLVNLLVGAEPFTIDLGFINAGWVWTLPATVLGFIAARVALGLTEGGNFPGAIKTVAEWFPVKERALATGIFNSGTNVGAMVCPIAVPWVASHLGWASTFYLMGGLGIFWLAAWWMLYDAPEKHRSVSKSELAYIQSGQSPQQTETESVPWLSLFSYRPVWAYLIASMLAGPVWNIYMFYFPDFMTKTFGLPLQEVGWWTSVFYLLASVGGVSGGWLAGRFLTRGWTVNRARKTTMLICALCVVPIFIAPHVATPWMAALIVGLAGSAHQGWSANIFSVVSDTMPRKAVSSVVGLGGFVAYQTGAFVTEGIGVILKKTGSYSTIFAAASLLYLASLLAIHLLVPRLGEPSSKAKA